MGVKETNTLKKIQTVLFFCEKKLCLVDTAHELWNNKPIYNFLDDNVSMFYSKRQNCYVNSETHNYLGYMFEDFEIQ